MQAFVLEGFDGPDALRLTATDEPVPGEGGVIVQVRAIGVNFPDLLTTRGKLPNPPERAGETLRRQQPDIAASRQTERSGHNDWKPRVH